MVWHPNDQSQGSVIQIGFAQRIFFMGIWTNSSGDIYMYLKMLYSIVKDRFGTTLINSFEWVDKQHFLKII